MNLVLASWNITGSCVSDKFPKHTWAKRKKHVLDRLLFCGAHAIALQEITGEQGMDLFRCAPHLNLVLFQQAETKELRAGTIWESEEEFAKVQHLNFGSMLIGILYNSYNLKCEEMFMFWYKENPAEPPKGTDRGETDKGFGNMLTPRGLGGLLFETLSCEETFEPTQFYFFTSHAPLSGNAPTRNKCFALEREVLSRDFGDYPYFSVGDRNILPDDNPQTSIDILYSEEHGKVYNWMHQTTHVGFRATWIGFSYDDYKAPIVNGELISATLDFGISTIPPLWSGCSHNVIQKDSEGEERCEPYGLITESDDLFASDHSMLIAGFYLK